MLSRCIFCECAFPENATLEHVPVGSRLAFDPRRGRLWAVCKRCGRWTLAPFDDRWEALEELERLATDRARLLGRTDTIALLQAGDVEVVRVGRSGLREEAWWRYGRALALQRTRIARLSGLNNVAFGAVVAAAAVTGQAAVLTGLGAWLAPGFFRHLLREHRFGMTAWRGEAACQRCGRTLSRVHFTERGRLVVGPGNEGRISVRLPCERCGADDAGAGYRLPERGAEHLLRRVLAFHNHAGASERRVSAAVEAIDHAGSPLAWVDRIAGGRGPLHALDRTSVLALEIALRHETERAALQTELTALEAAWGEAEDIAAIADGELTPAPALYARRASAAGPSSDDGPVRRGRGSER